jgi:calpain-15
MVASSNPGSDSNRSKNGVHQGHAYTFLNALYLNLGGRQERLVQLRNPWGIGEFTGKWSDYDPKWNWVPIHEKKRLHFNQNKKDGIFFMAYDDFISEFRTLTVA